MDTVYAFVLLVVVIGLPILVVVSTADEHGRLTLPLLSSPAHLALAIGLPIAGCILSYFAWRALLPFQKAHVRRLLLDRGLANLLCGEHLHEWIEDGRDGLQIKAWPNSRGNLGAIVPLYMKLARSKRLRPFASSSWMLASLLSSALLLIAMPHLLRLAGPMPEGRLSASLLLILLQTALILWNFIFFAFDHASSKCAACQSLAELIETGYHP